MLDPSGTWSVDGNNDGYEFIEFTPYGEVWTVGLTHKKDLPSMRGVGFFHQGYLCVARGIVVQPAELDGTVGLVQYELQNFGTLPARWYHPSLSGTLSEGLSFDGPSDGIVGEYYADYQDREGSAFTQLRKTILKATGCFHFSWWDYEKFHYIGIGSIVAGNLFAAWGPPGSIIQFVYYDFRYAETGVCGAWYDYGRGKRGIEVLCRLGD